MSPSIPEDVLASIFAYLPSGVIASQRTDHITLLPPLVVGQVSREWRVAAHSYPRLWCTLGIYLNGDISDRRYEDLDALIKWWMVRTKGQPLRLALSQNDTDAMRTETAHRLLWKVLAREVSRVVELLLDLPPKALHMFITMDKMFPILHRVEVTRVWDNQEDEPRLLSRAPLLRILVGPVSVMSAAATSVLTQPTTRPWSRLTHLVPPYDSELSTLILILILRMLPRLEVLAVRLVSAESKIDSERLARWHRGALEHRSLRSLELQDRSGEYTALAYLRFPSLQELKLQPLSCGSKSFERLLAFVRQSGGDDGMNTKLRRLELHTGMSFSHSDLTALFCAVPRLEELVYDSADWADVISVLRLRPLVLRRLKHIHLTAVTFRRPDWAVFAAIMEERRVTLQELVVTSRIFRIMLPGDEARVRRVIRDTGVRVRYEAVRQHSGPKAGVVSILFP